MFNKKALLISLMLLAGLFVTAARIEKAGTVSVNITLYGSAGGIYNIPPYGWGNTSSSITSPGPSLSFNQYDTVNLTLFSYDGMAHQFFVDYNNNSLVDAGEPVSPVFTSSTYYAFNTTVSGTFVYRCAFHPSLMYGVLTVRTSTANTAIPPEITNYAKDWPLPNRDYENTRFTADSSINSSNVGSLKLLWSFKIPGIGGYGGAASNPIIMGNNVYFQDLGANVFSLSLSDGHVNWQKIYNISAVVGPNGPAVGWGKVFVAKDLYTIAGLNATTGAEIWATTISNVSTTGIDIQPSVYDDMVYVSTVPGTADVFYSPGGIGVIYALNQTSGNVVWNFSTVDSPSLWGHPEINSGGGCWYTPSIDVNSGVMYWGIANPAPFPGVEGWPSGSSRPGPNLYTNTMMALDHNNGTIKWFTQVLPHDLLDHDLQIPPILTNPVINGTPQDIVIGSGKMGVVYAFNRDTGAILWQTAVGEHQNDTLDPLPNGTTRVLPGVFGGVETPMAYSVSNGILYVPVIDLFTDWTPTSLNISTLDLSKGTGELVAINVSTGNILWNKTFSSINVGAATVVNDVVFTATFDGTIYAFRDTTGEQLFSYKAPAGINGWPAVAGDTIVWPTGVGANASVIALGFACIRGDLNKDGIVDIYDAMLLAEVFGTTPSSSNWNPNADLNGDGTVDIYDAIFLAQNFGQRSL